MSAARSESWSTFISSTMIVMMTAITPSLNASSRALPMGSLTRFGCRYVRIMQPGGCAATCRSVRQAGGTSQILLAPQSRLSIEKVDCRFREAELDGFAFAQRRPMRHAYLDQMLVDLDVDDAVLAQVFDQIDP